jgi:hypothetical protein
MKPTGGFPTARPGCFPKEERMMLTAVNPAATKVLDQLTAGLEEYGHRRLDNSPGAFMAVVVEMVDRCSLGPVFSVAHYYTQNGDAMRDPEMLFVRASDGRYFPTYYLQDGLGIEQESADVHHSTFRPKMQRDHAAFENSWMRNIREQQGLLLEGRGAA